MLRKEVQTPTGARVLPLTPHLGLTLPGPLLQWLRSGEKVEENMWGEGSRALSPPGHAAGSYWISLIKHKFKEKITEN